MSPAKTIAASANQEATRAGHLQQLSPSHVHAPAQGQPDAERKGAANGGGFRLASVSQYSNAARPVRNLNSSYSQRCVYGDLMRSLPAEGAEANGEETICVCPQNVADHLSPIKSQRLTPSVHRANELREAGPAEQGTGNSSANVPP